MVVKKIENKIKGDFQVVSSIQSITDVIHDEIKKGKRKIAIEFYPLTNEKFIESQLIEKIKPDLIIHSDDYFIDSAEMNELIKDYITEDRIFGVMSHYKMEDFIDKKKLEKVQDKLSKNEGVSVVYGVGASLVKNYDLLLYVDLPRWNVLKRYKSGDYSNWNTDNLGDDPQRLEKQGYFFEWPLADRQKKSLFDKIDYILDVVDENNPKMMVFSNYYESLKQISSQPFSLNPFFAPGIWGGKWMQEKFNIGKDKENLAWSFHGVPEENSITLKINTSDFETSGSNLVLLFGETLLGEKVFNEFGDSFPIRFNLLDTWGGQNLSLQVHPKKDYIKKVFGFDYTQEESYYVLDAAEDAVVYLGVNNGVKKEELFTKFKEAESGSQGFDDEKYINKIKIKKHDHYLIPPGTIHSSGKDSVILEISATPNRFTFKLWDWGRVDFDGLPRPINLEHGEANVDIYKDRDWVEKELVNQFEEIATGEGWIEERTGLHESEFIETRRHTFSEKVIHQTHDSVNVLSLIEGDQAIVKSPDNSFPPFIVEYAQVFIIPESVKSYTIEPYSKGSNKELKTIKAFVR